MRVKARADRGMARPLVERGEGDASRRARQAMWLSLALLLLLPFLSQPGRYVADTRDALWFSTGTYVSNSFTLWQSSPSLGHAQRDAIVVPMGALVWLLRSLAVPLWAVERLWHGLLLFTAAAGVVLLIDHLRGRRGLVAPAVGALAYALTPYAFGFGLATTGPFVPYALLPFLLLVTMRTLPRGGLLGPALFGLTTFLMGGGNGAPQAYAVLVALAYVVWAVAVERSVRLHRALTYTAWSLLFALGLNAYWLLLLVSGDVPNTLAATERPEVINVASSYSESVRGLGFWAFYGGDASGPWLPMVRRFISSPLFIVTGFAVPAAAVASAWLLRLRHRLFFLFLAILAVLVMAGIFPVDSPTPFGRLLLFAYDHVPGAAGLRTTYKFGAALNLSVAVLAAALVEDAWRRLPAPEQVGWRAALAAATVLVLGVNAFPLWSGGLYNGARTAAGIPGYWRRALDRLEQRQEGYRAFFAPGALSTFHRWGGLHEGVAEATPELSSVHRNPLPIGQRYGSNLLAAVEQPYQAGLPAENWATLLRYLGVRDVVLQNDVDWQRSHTARPGELQVLARDPSLEPLTSFGVARGLPEASAEGGPLAEVERTLPPVQVLTVPDPLPVVRAEGGGPLVVSGDGFGLAALARQGLLQGNPPVLYSGDLGPEELRVILRDRPTLVITDSNRRRVWSFSGVRRNYSYTLPAGATIGDRPPGFGLFGDRPETQSVAVYEGVAAITASGYGSPFEDQPEYRPSNAFDGDPDTWWLVGALTDPVGAWAQVTFDRARTLSRVALSLPDLGFGRQVRAVRIEFSDGTSVLSPVEPVRTEVEFAPRETDSVRVRILAVTEGPPDALNAVGFSDIEIPGLFVREVVRLPTDLLDTARRLPEGLEALAASPLLYLVERARSDDPGLPDEEATLGRAFLVPSPRPFTVEGVARLSPSASDTEIDDLIRGAGPVQAFSSSRLFGNPRFRGSKAMDGDEDTAWVPAGALGETLTVRFPERTVDRLEVQAAVGPDRAAILAVEVSFPDGSTVTGAPPDPLEGLIALRFRPRRTSELTITITSVAPAVEGPTFPVGIAEVRIPGVKLPRVGGRTPLPCRSGPWFTLDGEPVSIRLSGTVADLLDGRTLPLTTCDREPLDLTAGWHELFAGGAIQVDRLLLASSPGGARPAERPPAPAIAVHPRGGGYDVDVRDAEGPFYLVIGQTADPGWRATIDGMELGPPLVLDGYSAGWRIERTGSFQVSVRYAPQGSYRTGLLVSAVALAAALAVGARTVARRRNRPLWRRGP